MGCCGIRRNGLVAGQKMLLTVICHSMMTKSIMKEYVIEMTCKVNKKMTVPVPTVNCGTLYKPPKLLKG